MKEMLLLGKIVLGFGATVLLAGAYTFREGVVRVSVDESRGNEHHVHVWLPAAVIPMALHFVPRRQLERAGDHAADYMPLVHVIAKELQKYPEADLVEVRDGEEHVHVSTHNGTLLIDVDQPGEVIHVACPLATIDDVSRQLAEFAPGA